MIAPSEQTARAIVNLAGNPNWDTILRWIDESAILQSLKNNHNRGEETIVMQGRNMELEDFLKIVAKAKAGDYTRNVEEARRMENKK
ncbi:MAG TPA: hypothetical protein VJZ49_15580 [Syntrophales bacterium]|nr:hypothetical protein [Syntrophales bacterium]